MSKSRAPKQIRDAARLLLRNKQGGKCCYCERQMMIWGKPTRRGGLPKDAETLEHLRRLEDGGNHSFDNLALACHECNIGRGSVDWLTYKSLKSGELEAAA